MKGCQQLWQCHGLWVARYGNLCGVENGREIDAKRSHSGEARWAYLAGKWDEVVFTKTVNGDFPDEDHFVVIFGEDCVVDNV